MSDQASRSVAMDDSEGEITLGILNAVEENSKLTQRSIAGDLGIALGLANAYLKRCVRKGLIKVQQVPSNRYAYYLTPQGFAEKSRLTSEYLTSSFQFFRRAKVQCADLLQNCEHTGVKRIGLVGVSDLAEIVALSALDSTVELAGIVDSTVRIERFAGNPVFASVEKLGPVDALLVTTLKDPQGRYDKLRREHPDVPVLHVPLLRISDKDEKQPGPDAMSDPERLR
ncbi:winged helix-turn-helix transcriptional regulator [Hwanghaeella sp.]|uniref:winged helix-turn-helix transcriptional regulator n=1 Tax=Hwanghaeella sp. TaxID=2605943 RepID=UPI003CCC2B82